MFGYVREYAPELKVKDYNLYKAVYCGLCHSMGKHTGNLSRFTLSYDMVFLALVRMALEETVYKVNSKRCIIHPLKKRPALEDNSVLEYVSSVSALLSYAKLKDDIADSTFTKRTLYRLLIPVFSYAKKRAGQKELFEIIWKYLCDLSEVENKKEASIDIPADIFGKITASIFEYALSGNNKRIAGQIGYYIGKWIYVIDALDDYTKDLKSTSYNPFILLYGDNISNADLTLIESAFTENLVNVENALDLINFTDASLSRLIYNVLYEGMRKKAEDVVKKYKKEKDIE